MRRIAAERQRRWLVVGGIAAMLLIGFQWQRHQLPDRLYADAARDHQLEVLDHQPRHWRSDLAAIEPIASRFGITRAQISDFAPAGLHLARAKVCGLDGSPALHLVYSDGRREISMYVRRGAFASLKAVTAEIGPERLASAGNGRYSTLIVSTGSLEECRQLARRTADLL